MDRRWQKASRQLVVLIAGLGAVTITHPAIAATVTHNQVRGDMAFGDFWMADGCKSASSMVDSSTSLSKVGEPEFYTRLIASVQDVCSGEWLAIEGYGDPSSCEFGVKGQSAQLKCTMEVLRCTTDYVCDSGTAIIDMQWTGNNDARQSRYSSRVENTDSVEISNFSGVYSTASASGTITLDGTTLINYGDMGGWSIIAANSSKTVTRLLRK